VSRIPLQVHPDPAGLWADSGLRRCVCRSASQRPYRHIRCDKLPTAVSRSHCDVVHRDVDTPTARPLNACLFLILFGWILPRCRLYSLVFTSERQQRERERDEKSEPFNNTWFIAKDEPRACDAGSSSVRPYWRGDARVIVTHRFGDLVRVKELGSFALSSRSYAR